MEPSHRSERLRKIMEDTPTPDDTNDEMTPPTDNPPAKRRRTKKRPTEAHLTAKDNSPSTDADLANTSEEVDPTRVDQPVSAAVHPNLQKAWAINKTLPMCFIFDHVSPARRFKRGMLFSDDIEYPAYNQNTGGRGGLTWQAHCEFVESF
jgi:hypothetical protein